MKYKRKEKIIEAIQWDGSEDTLQEIRDFCPTISWNEDCNILLIDCSVGTLQVDIGDYIILELDGDFDVYPESGFLFTYEKL